jgi:hypothetical protein
LIKGSGRPALLTGLSVLAIVAARTTAVASAASAPPAVSVEAAGDALTVRITQPTPLRTVLETVCERTEANCKLPAKTADKLLESRTVHGSWFEVVGELLQGSGLSFAVTPPVRGRNAYLVVELAAAATAHADTVLPPASSGVSGVTAGAETAVSQAEPTSEETQPAAEPQPDETPRAVMMSPDSPLVTAATAAATPGASFAMTPFSDAAGNPIMARLGPAAGASAAANIPGMAVLPYSDDTGNPILVPITNEPLALTPFAGPDGQPWPAPVPQPNQKLEYPIPPTPLTQKPENP